MTDESNDEETPGPSEEELKRTEAALFAELAKESQVPFKRRVVRTDALFAIAIEDPDLVEAFPLDSPYLEGDRRISHALIHWMGPEKPTHVLEWWAPYRLLRPDELAEAEYLADIEPLLMERGLIEGAAQVKESFMIEPPEGEERSLLGLEPSDRAMFVSSEYRDRDGRPILLRRQVMASGGVGRVRDVMWEKQHGGTYRFEY
jgi:hypothetical protein